MHADELIRSWKDPLSRDLGMEHPSGVIVLDESPLAGIRARLLAGKAGMTMREDTWSNGYACPCDGESGDEDWWNW